MCRLAPSCGKAVTPAIRTTPENVVPFKQRVRDCLSENYEERSPKSIETDIVASSAAFCAKPGGSMGSGGAFIGGGLPELNADGGRMIESAAVCAKLDDPGGGVCGWPAEYPVYCCCIPGGGDDDWPHCGVPVPFMPLPVVMGLKPFCCWCICGGGVPYVAGGVAMPGCCIPHGWGFSRPGWPVGCCETVPWRYPAGVERFWRSFGLADSPQQPPMVVERRKEALKLSQAANLLAFRMLYARVSFGRLRLRP